MSIPLIAKELKKTYRTKGKIVEAVVGVSLSVERGEIHAFLGPNGAGKTTTIKMIAGLIRPDSGEVQVNGRDPHHNRQALADIGAVLEGNRNIYWRLTAEENIQYFGVLKGMRPREARNRGAELLDRFGMTQKKRSLAQTLSRGMQQKLAVAVGLVHSPKLLLLDEPTLGLDVESVEVIKEQIVEIAEEGCAIVLTTHHLDVAEALANRISIISSGRIIIEESTSELIKRFSGEAYTIGIRGVLSSKQLAALGELETIVNDSEIVYLGSPSGLYRVFEAIRPISISQVVKNGADLTEIFLKLIKEDQHA